MKAVTIFLWNSNRVDACAYIHCTFVFPGLIFSRFGVRNKTGLPSTTNTVFRLGSRLYHWILRSRAKFPSHSKPTGPFTVRMMVNCVLTSEWIYFPLTLVRTTLHFIEFLSSNVLNYCIFLILKLLKTSNGNWHGNLDTKVIFVYLSRCFFNQRWSVGEELEILTWTYRIRVIPTPFNFRSWQPYNRSCIPGNDTDFCFLNEDKNNRKQCDYTHILIAWFHADNTGILCSIDTTYS